MSISRGLGVSGPSRNSKMEMKTPFPSALLIFLMVLGSCSGPSGVEYPTNPFDSIDNAPLLRNGTLPSIMFAGDSRSEFGGTFDALPNTVYNIGVGHSSIRSVLKKEYRISAIMPDYLVLFTGFNDAKYFSPAEFRSDLISLSHYLESLGIKFIIMDQSVEPQALNETQKVLGYIMRSIPGSKYLPVSYTAGDHVSDGIHLSGPGYLRATAVIDAEVNR